MLSRFTITTSSLILATPLGHQSDSTGLFYPVADAERKRRKTGLFSKVVKFDHFKTRVVKSLSCA